MTPYGLQTEQRTEPLGLGEARPRLSWKLRADRHGAAQTAYRIVAAERATDLDDPARLIWDSGRRDSDQTLLITWDGPALRSATRYHWRVDVFDETAAPAGTAQTWFETGLLHGEDWTAAWIGRDPAALPLVDPPTDDDLISPGPAEAALHLRRDFQLPKQPIRARLYATARGVYEPQLNGERAGDHELAPGWTEYHHRIQYQTYDVTGQIRAGANTVAATVADGWWSGYVGFDPRRPARHYGDTPGFLAQLVLDFADGSRQIVATDAQWTEHDSPIRSADLMMGQFTDGRRELSGPRPVAVLDTETGPLVAEPDEPIRVTAELPAVTIDNGIADFGQNLVGRVRLTIRDAEAGQRIVLRHAEVLTADGSLYLDNLRRAAATDTYICAGHEIEVFEPRFTFHGFRYAEVTGYTPHPDDVTAQVLHSDTPWTGRFESSDPTVNQLHANICWGQRGNFVAVPTDCPQRDERLGWLADAQVFAPTATRNADVSAFFARWMRDVVDGQNADGAFRDVAPIIAFDREGAPAWGDGGVIIPWLLWRTYGDRRVLERSFDAMAAWVEHIHRHNPGLLWENRTGNSYGDWLQIDAETPRDVLSTAYFAHSTAIVATAASVLNRTAQAAKYRELHAGIKQAFTDAFVSDDGSVKGGSQTVYLLALAFDLLPNDLKSLAVAHLAADIESRGNRLTTGFVGVSLLCPVLTEHGRADLAYALLHQDEYPSWNYSIRHGATTIWERWDGWTEEHGFQSAAMNSFNHYSLGSVGDWLYGRVAGIDQTPDSVAYSELLLHPTPDPTGRLTWARAEQETARGLVACGWSKEDDRLTVTATVPPGSTAILLIPTSDPGSVHAAETPGVLRAEPSGAGLTLRLTSGRYTFITPPDSSPTQETPMRSRKITALTAAIATAALLTACSSGPGAGSSDGDNKTLTIASVDQGSIEKVVEAFKAANPGVTVNLTTSGADQYQQQIRTQLSSGTAPDVMTVWPGNGNPGATYVLAKPGYLLDLSDQPWAAKLPDSFQKVAQYEGKTYNAVFGLNGIGAVYNDQAMTESGLTAPGTWTDLLAFCKAAAGKGTPAFALGIQDNWVTQIALYGLVATTVYSTDRDFDTKMAAGQATFAGSPWTTAMAKYQEMDSAGCFQKDPLGTSYEASQTLAATGKTLGIIQGNWIIGLLKQKNPSGTFTMKALPATDDTAQFIMPAAAGAGYGVNAKAKNKELALKFITFVMSPEGMKTFNEAQGSLPTLPGAGTTVDPGLAELTTFVEGNKTVPFMDQLWPNAKVQQTMLSGLQEVFSDQTTAADVLKDMDTDYKAGA